MSRQHLSRFSLALTVGTALAFAIWTVLVATGTVAEIDERLAITRPPALASAVGQIAAAIAVITHPLVVYTGLLVVAVWAFRRRLRLIAMALALSLPVAAGGRWLLSHLLARPRPEGLDLITQTGYAYPSGHVTAATVASILVTATVVVTRQSTSVTTSWRLGGVAVVSLVAIDRWLLGAHWFSDLVGGLLFGSFAAVACLVLAGVKVVPPELTQLTQRRSRGALLADGTEVKRRCAIIFNPTKVTDENTFRRHVNYELHSRGWAKPIWLETSPDDPGFEMTAIARRKQVDLVLGAGGDGTIRAICGGLAGSGIPFGLIPAGTGNLLAKNLGIPLDEQAALELAFDGIDRHVDLVSISADGGTPEYFCVMAGIGIDAAIISGTNADLKKAVGSAAYFVAAAQHANHQPLRTTFYVDDHEPFTRVASVILIGNVGSLQGGIAVIPDAKPDDGVMDLAIASATSATDWMHVVTRVMARQRRTDERLDRFTATRIRLVADRPDAYQVDGDTLGTASELEFRIHPGTLTIRLPR